MSTANAFTKNSKYLTIALIALLQLWSHCEAKGSLITLDEDNWEQMLSGEWMVEFYAPWCPACKSLEPQWKSFSSWSDDLNIKIAAIDVTANPGLSGRFMVTALPTIYHVKDGVFRQYKGARDSNTFVSFVEDKKWQTLETISNWKAPNTFQMSIVSYFFKISMALRAVHNRLVDDYGIPYWGSYILFAFATILLGAILGLLIVCVIDLLFPAKVTPEEMKANKKDSNKDADLTEEDIRDESVASGSGDKNELRKRTLASSSAQKDEQNE